MHRRPPAAIPVACALGVAAAVWALRVVRDARAYEFMRNGDLYAYFLPLYEVAFAELRAGRLFLWNPWLLNGLPGLATLEVGLLYPLHWIYAVLPTATAMGLLSALHVLLALVFTRQLARTLGLGEGAALLAGFAFGFSHALASLFWLPGLEPLPWLPLGLDAIERLWRGAGRRWLAVLAASTAFPILCGSYQVAFYVLAAFALYAALRAAGALLGRTPVREVGARTAWILAAGVAGLALAAPQLLPALELSRASVRAPEALGPAQVLPLGRPVSGLAALWRLAVDPPEQFRVGYVGAVPLALAAAGLFARGFGARAFCLVLVLWSGVAILAPDAYLELRSHVPVLAWFRLPQRTLVLGQLGVALLAGAGWEALRDVRPARRAAAAAALAGVCALALGTRLPSPLAALPVLLTGVACAAILVGRDAWRPVFTGLALSLAVLDLVGATRNTLRLPYVADDGRHTRAHDAFFAALARRAGSARTLLVGAERNLPEWSQKSGLRARLRTPADYEPLAPARIADLFAFVATRRPWPRDASYPFVGAVPEFFQTVPRPEWRRLFRLLGVRYFVFPGPMHRDPRIAAFARDLTPLRLDAPAPSDPRLVLALFEDPDALPRAYAVLHAECPDGDRALLERLTSADFDPLRSVLLEGGCARETPPRERAAPVTIERDEPELVRVVVDVARPGFFVLTDTHEPGWRARLDGEPAPVLRANWTFRAVAVPAGRHVVELRYEPASFRGGVVLAGLALLAGAALAVRPVLRRHRVGPRPSDPERADGANARRAR
jgi:hypothetical protein